MASNSIAQLVADGYALPSSNNYVASMWADKRSATHVGLSFVLTGSGTPDGYVHVETSNAPENYAVSYGSGPLGGANPLDLETVPGSTQAVNAVGSYRWDISTPSRWIRVVFVPTISSANLNAYVWCSVPFESA